MEAVRSYPSISGGLPRGAGGSAPALCVSRPARRSLKLQPTCSQSRYNDPLHRRLQRLCYLYRCFGCYRVKRTSSRVGLSPTEKHRLVTAHRSSTITEPSSLLQVGPPQAIASVLSPRGFLPLCFSLSIDGLVPAVPHKSLCRTHAPYTPAATRPVIRLLAGLSQKTRSLLVSTALDTLTTRLRWVCLRSSFRHSPAPGHARDFSPDAHHHGSLPQQLGLV
jgi:hypothetical protein